MTNTYYNSPRLHAGSFQTNPDGSFGVKLDLLKRDVRSVIAQGNDPNAAFYLEELRGMWEASLEARILQQVTGAPATDITAVFAAAPALGDAGIALTQGHGKSGREFQVHPALLPSSAGQQ